LDDWSKPADQQWPAFGGDWGNTRYSDLSQINAANIRQLNGAWVAELDSTSRSTPVIADGLMFICTMTRVYALDAHTGTTVWSYQPMNSAPATRGVAVGRGLVFVGLANGGTLALKERTGELAWQALDNDPSRRGQMVTFAPSYAGGLVITAVSGGDYGVNGRVIANDAESGREVWQFAAIPGPGDFGHDTWPQDSAVWEHGGGAVWMTPAIDSELGLVYVGIGNAVPQFGGELRGGDNLFTSSVVAIDLKTGKLRWYFQLVHHDIWDADLGTPLVLYNTSVHGQRHKNLAVMRTDGYLFLLDRETGRPALPIEERPVKQDARLKTSPTQPFPVNADRIGPDCVDPAMIPAGFIPGCWFDPLYYDRPNVAYPGIAMRAAPMSYDPRTGLFYATGTVGPWWYQRTENPRFFAVSRIPGQREYGIIAAIDSRTDKIVWQRRTPFGLVGGGGATSTAGGLMFHLEPDGNLQAYDVRTGSVLWQFQTGFDPGRTAVGPGGGSIASYAVESTQYVATVVNRGVWAFKLNGTLKPREAPPLPFSEYPFGGLVAQFPIEDAKEVALGALREDTVGDAGGDRTSADPEQQIMDEYAFKPVRARVTVGSALRFMNYGIQVHTIAAEDGSWTTGPILPGQSATVTFNTPGTYTYVCKDHLWSRGQLIVASAAKRVALYSAVQADHGKDVYRRNCSQCHMENLGGNALIPPVAGDSFLQNWASRSVGDLYEKIRTTMPKGAPDSLEAEGYLDVVAYLLQANGYPAGATDLSNDLAQLKYVKMKDEYGKN